MVSNIPGIHNVQNVLAACAMSVELGIPIEVIKDAQKKYNMKSIFTNFLKEIKKNFNGRLFKSHLWVNIPKIDISGIEDKEFSRPLLQDFFSAYNEYGFGYIISL